jgi:hypothetical protein
MKVSVARVVSAQGSADVTWRTRGQVGVYTLAGIRIFLGACICGNTDVRRGRHGARARKNVGALLARVMQTLSAISHGKLSERSGAIWYLAF